MDIMTEIDMQEIILYLLLFLLFVAGLILVNKKIDKELTIEKEIIKQSDNYIIFKECTEIQDNWYCKKEND